MVSQNKIEANRRNAQLSTGPKTEEGKARSSQNSLQHGLTSQTFTLLPTEDPALYQAYISETLAAYNPRTSLETALVIRLAQILWQLGRLPAALSQLIQHKMQEHPGSTPEQVMAMAFCDESKPNAFERLQRYESALDRTFAKTLQHLRQLQSGIEPTDAAPSPIQKEPMPAPRTSPSSAVQKEAIAPPITLSPGHPVTRSSLPPAPAPNEATRPSSSSLTPAQRRLLHTATSRVNLPIAGSML